MGTYLNVFLFGTVRGVRRAIYPTDNRPVGNGWWFVRMGGWCLYALLYLCGTCSTYINVLQCVAVAAAWDRRAVRLFHKHQLLIYAFKASTQVARMVLCRCRRYHHHRCVVEARIRCYKSKKTTRATIWNTNWGHTQEWEIPRNNET